MSAFLGRSLLPAYVLLVEPDHLKSQELHLKL